MRKSNPDLRVTWLARRHLPRVVQIERMCFPDPWTHEQFTAELNQPQCIGMFATNLDRAVLGYVIYELHWDHLRLLNIAVEPLVHRDGAGSAMVASMAGKLTAEGRNRIVTEVRESNRVARTFLRAMNFKCIRVHHGRYEGSSEKAVEYVLTLSRWNLYVAAAIAAKQREVMS